ncbi:OLC1v1027576C1 [Oldenlandia corymbosa var. corymbosa]|nr:OLC1v1027576C1 [Oldenlandia corymbosa var. corymbosa]
MSRFQSNRRLEKNQPVYDDDEENASPEARDNDGEKGGGQNDASSGRDYVNVPSQPYIMKILSKQGDRNVLFADRVMKFTGSGKMKKRILLITEFAIYILDPDTYALKRRIALAAVEKLCLSGLGDHFFAIIIPTEYDILMASTRKSEIVSALLEATKSASDYELDVLYSTR